MNIRHYIAILILFISLPFAGISQENEEQLREEAEALFDAVNYKDAFNKYSQLLSLQLQSAEYNYRFGACQLFTSHDKEQALKYLKYAVDTEGAPNLAHFYYGLGLHLNYRFEKALKEYDKYKANAGKKEKENQLVDHYIQQCKSGIDLVSNFTDISVIQREALPRSDFYRNYDLSEFGGKIMVKPEDFMSEEDKKRDAKFLMYFQQDADYIYYASHSDKNETGKDLFVIQKLPTGDWSKPQKLSSVINTPYDEDYPFIHPDGNVLYFASKGHNSMGGYDIFKSTRRGDGTWTEPINMEFAINTPWDDFLFISDKAEETAWFASNRETNSSQVDVFKIGIQRVPLDLTLIKGTFIADGSNKAKITIEDMVQNKVIGIYESERQFGEYLLDLRGSGQYKFIVEAEESNAVHTGLVEVPREKGLKQFRQEMTLTNVDGQERLQIINHFDEPIEDASLLTADILKKQASLDVNASEDDIVRTTEILDDETANNESAANADLSNEEKLSQAENTIASLEAEATLLDNKASVLTNIAEEKSASSDPMEIAEAAIAAELAGEYKSEADSRRAAAEKMQDTYDVLSTNDLEESAFNAQYNQMYATGENFQPVENFETKLEDSYAERTNPSTELYEAKLSERDEINDDISSINEEIAYLSSELENTKDDALKEEYSLQIDDAKAAIPSKNAELDRANKELEVAQTQKASAESYAALTTSLLETAASSASSVSTTASAATINELQLALSSKALADPALVAFVAPDKAAEATAVALAESRKATSEESNDETDQKGIESSSGSKDGSDIAEATPSGDVFENDEGNAASDSDFDSGNSVDASGDDEVQGNDGASDFFGDNAEETDDADASEDFFGDTDNTVNTSEANSGTNTESIENSDNFDADSEDFFSDDTTTETTDGSESNPIADDDFTSDESSQDVNDEIRTITGSESSPEIVSGNYNAKFEQELAEASNAEDPIIAESRKAEIYDQWVENIEYRIDSLKQAQDETSDTEQKLELASQISSLEDEKEAKNDLAMASYAEVATLSDEQASNQNFDPTSDNDVDSFEDENENTTEGENTNTTELGAEDNAESTFSDDFSEDFFGEESFSDDESSAMNEDALGAEDSESEIRQVNPDSIPPVTPDILNAEEVPPLVLQLNSSYTQQMAGARALPTKVEQKNEEARINKEWANELAYQLNVLSAQIETVESPEQRNKLNELSANVASLRAEKENKVVELQKQIEVEEKEAALAQDKQQLQQVVNQYVESYNTDAFLQLEEQVENESNPEVKKAQTEVLNQNWMVALKNEEIKTEARISNSTDPRQKAELEEKLVKIQAEKLYVQANLDSLETSELDGPAPPKAVVVKGSEKFEGYIPVATSKPQEYDSKTQKSYNAIDRLNTQIAELDTKIEGTRKKKDKAALELEKESLVNELEVAQLETKFYEDAEPKIIGVEPLILQLESGDPTPSQTQMQVAQSLEEEANQLTEAARVVREDADAIRKKKKRLPAQAAARDAEQIALLKRNEADLALNLANEMAVIEAEAIANNFIIPSGQEVTLPVVNTKLNPTETEDVAATEQFTAYNSEKRKADSLRSMATRLLQAEEQLNTRAQNLMLETSLDPEVRLRTNAQAFVIYDKADSISAEAARLNRQAAFIENEANQQLLQNPEEVYTSILAYFNSDSTRSLSDTTGGVDIADITGDISGDEDFQNSTSDENASDAASGQENYDLTPPTENNTSVSVQPSALTNTIFEATESSESFYSESTPIPVDPPLPSGLIYKVQIGAFRNPIKQDAFKGIKPITGESTGTGLTRYSAGEFTNFAEADLAKDEIRGIGYRDAFVVAYRNGKRVGSGNSASSATSSNGNQGTASNRLPSTSIVKQGALKVEDVSGKPGTFFTVQVGVFSRPVKSSDIYNITPLNQENLSNGTYRYTTGVYKNESTAEQAKNEIRSLGISDAFVTAYRDGTRTTVADARTTLGGSSEAAPVATSSTYQVFLGTYTGDVPLNQATIILGLSSSGVEKTQNGDGSSSYYYGSFSTQQEAQSEADRLVGEGLNQAKVQTK